MNVMGQLDEILRIVVIDLVLSGDNAVVIGMAARNLPPQYQKKAVFWGAGGAIGLRVILTVMISLLLNVPLLQAAGALLLTWIAIKLLIQETPEGSDVRAGANLWDAIRTIILADFVMSLDNMLAVGGVGHGRPGLVLFGLLLSISIIMFGSTLIARLLNRVPQLAYLGSGILGWTAGEMFLSDKMVQRWILGEAPGVSYPFALHYGMPAALAVAVVAGGYAVLTRARLAREAREHAGQGEVAAEAEATSAEPRSAATSGARAGGPSDHD